MKVHFVVIVTFLPLLYFHRLVLMAVESFEQGGDRRRGSAMEFASPAFELADIAIGYVLVPLEKCFHLLFLLTSRFVKLSFLAILSDTILPASAR